MKNKTIIAVAAVGFMSVVSLIAMNSLVQPSEQSVKVLETKMGPAGFESSKKVAVKNGKKTVSKAVEKKEKVLSEKKQKQQRVVKKSDDKAASVKKTKSSMNTKAQQTQKKAEQVKTKSTSKKLDLSSNVCPCLNKPKPKPPVTGNKIETKKRPL